MLFDRKTRIAHHWARRDHSELADGAQGAEAQGCRMSNPDTTPRSTIELTVFSKTGGPLTKRVTLTADGKIASDGIACYMARGRAKRVRIGGVGELAALIERSDLKQAIALGSLRDGLPDEVRIVTKAAIARAPRQRCRRPDRREPRLSARTVCAGAVRFRQQRNDAVGVLDAAGGFWPALVSVLPALATAGHLVRLSTSAGLGRADTGEAFPGSGGLHAYVTIADGTDAARFLKTLHARCWLAGFGWMNVGSAGQLLERSIIDRMVGAPERLVFEGPPVVEPPLHQDAAKRHPNVVAGDVLDSVVACPPLSVLEQQAFDQLRAQAKQRLKASAPRSVPHGLPPGRRASWRPA